MAEPLNAGHAAHAAPQKPASYWLQRAAASNASDAHAHAPLPSTLSRHAPPWPHGAHSVHAAPKRPDTPHAAHAPPVHAASQAHEPSSRGSPCDEHVEACENSHAGPACDASHTHAVAVGVPAALHKSARVRSQDALEPSSPSLHAPPLTHVHGAHAAPKKPRAQRHEGPRYLSLHVQTPAVETEPCALHVTARENWHTAPLYT